MAIHTNSAKSESSISGDGEGYHLTNFQLAEKTLRAIASGEEHPNAVRVQACLGLMRLIQMQVELLKHILEGKEEASIASERRSLEGLSPEELAREYQRELERLR